MDRKLHLTMLWHQHQPYYKDDSENMYHMPWVYMHAIKDYYEMARHVENSNVKATFNYVPSLLLQLEDYTSLDVPDKFIQLLKKPVDSLTFDEKEFIINQCFMANQYTMIKPLERFNKLYELKTIKGTDASNFTNEDILDLEVLYLLSWTGVFIRQEDPHIKELLIKGRDFYESEKLKLLENLAKWVEKVIYIHKKLESEGKIELTTTPFYHPITPLLIDINSAYESFKDVNIPNVDNNLSQDAVVHLKEGIDKFQDYFGFKPVGLWPAEGSISQKAVELWCENNIRWIASDEEVLANSLKCNLKDPKNRYKLYYRHYQVHNDKKINIFFRDKFLSDLIGFTYSSWKVEDAVEDFVGHLRNIYTSVDFSPNVSVILDGENAWEYYNNNAYEFFTLLYKRLGTEDFISCDTFKEVLDNTAIPEESVQSIQAGSWIMGNFKIWIGHSEKNTAWEYISLTRNAIESNISKVDKDTAKQIYKELYISEGSDWFWWFGDDHFSAQAEVFDKLFRTHLVNIYKLLKLNVPAYLYNPIKKSSKTGGIRKPSYYITPKIDSINTSFFDWSSSGEYDLKADAGSMHAGGDIFKKLIYGFDSDNLYLRFDTSFNDMPGEKIILQINVFSKENTTAYELNVRDKNINLDNGVKALFDKVTKISIPIKAIRELYKDKIYIQFVLKADNKVIDQAPLYNKIEVDIIENFQSDWMV